MVEADEKKERDNLKTILVVDDDEGPRESLRMILKPLYNVVVAGDGISGWNEYKKTRPDLILTDLKMPKMNGMSLIRQIRQEDFLTPLIIVTGYGTRKSEIEAGQLGVDHYFHKPYRVDDIRHLIDVILSKNPLGMEALRLRKGLLFFQKENKTLRERLGQVERTSKAVRWLRSLLPHWLTGDYAEKYGPICGAVAHSLKSEFLHIGNSIKEIRELAPTLSPIQEDCDIIERSIEYSQLLLRRLLDYLDLGKPPIESIDTLDLLKRIETLIKPRLLSNVRLQITIDQSLKGRTISANKEQLMGVLIELINNSINVLREKGGIIEVELEGRDRKIGISVKDNGPGISGKLRKKLFKKQVSSKGGSGLGLFLSNRVVRGLGGKLDLHTSSEEGTTITILLPLINDVKEP